jgi:predicted nucleotidyltransferase
MFERSFTMFDILDNLKDKPKFINTESVSYLTVMGSRAYGTATDDSDWDYYGFCVPPVKEVFPHVEGIIPGFGNQVQRFEQFQAQHWLTSDGRESDIQIYNIVKYFQLCMNGNPNMIDSLFTPDICVINADIVGQMVRNHRKIFLSQKCYHTFKGMAHSHMSRLMSRERVGNRKELVNEFGYDTKDAAHIMRLVYEMFEVLFTGDLSLRTHSGTIRSIREGYWSKEDIIKQFQSQMKFFDDNQDKFVVPYSPDEAAIKSLLVNCLEEKYGNLSKIGFGY